MDPSETQTETAQKRQIRSWWPFGRRKAPDPSIAQVMAQWAEYELIFNDILTRLSAQLARQAKFEKRRLDKLAETETTKPAPAVVPTTKQQLRTQYALSRFGGRIQELLADKVSDSGNGEPHEPQ